MKKQLTVPEIVAVIKEKKIPISRVEKACGFGNGLLKTAKTLSPERTEKLQAYFNLNVVEMPELVVETVPEPEEIVPEVTPELAERIAENNKPENKERILKERNTIPERIPSQYPLTEGAAFDPAGIAAQLKRLEALEKIEAFCNEHNCTPEDLMQSYAGKKPVIKPDPELANLLSTPKKTETYFEKRQREKMAK